MVKTDVHFPTDISLLFDAMRKVITLVAQWCDDCSMSDWRQHVHNVNKLKRLCRSAQNRKRSKAQAEQKQQENQARIIAAHQEYLELANHYLAKARQTLATLAQAESKALANQARQQKIEDFTMHAARQIDQIKRRVIDGQTIAHEEKVFSVFEPHTEWVCKGKAGVPVELGVRVCVLEDQHQFILHHQVMPKQTDEQVAVPMVTEAKKRFPALHACSFDKGFHSPANQVELRQHLAQVTLPKKGKLSKQAQAEQNNDAFVKARRAHSAVESAIHNLGVHGLDRCRDRGVAGFNRRVAFAVVACNIHRIGAILWQQEVDRTRRKRASARPFQQAA